MDTNVPTEQWIHRFTRRLRMRLPIGIQEALMICDRAYPAARNLIPEDVAEAYIREREPEEENNAAARPAEDVVAHQRLGGGTRGA